jgi:ABC transporter
MPRASTVTPQKRQQSNLPFREFLHWFHTGWEQGEHVTLVGPTGCGKSTLIQYLLARRSYVTTFATKKSDSTMDRLVRAGYKKQTGKWDGSYYDYICLWPTHASSTEETLAKQYPIFHQAIDDMYNQGGWCMNFDEVSYMTDFLGLSRKLRWLLQQGRSSGISIVAATQRPAFIPLAFYDQPEWLIFWNDNDHTNLKRIQGLGGEDGKVIRQEVMSLGDRQILAIHNRHPYERVKTTVRIR